jgi:hypothetical protein
MTENLKPHSPLTTTVRADALVPGQPVFLAKRGWLVVTSTRPEGSDVVLTTKTRAGIPDVLALGRSTEVTAGIDILTEY